MTLCFHCLATHGGWQQEDLSVLPWEVELAFIHRDETPSELPLGGKEPRQDLSQTG